MAADNFIWFVKGATGGNLTGNPAKPQGETQDKWFKPLGGIECKSVGFGVSQPESTGSGTSGSAAGKAKFEEISIEKDVDLSSVPLYQACAAGAHFDTLMLANRKAGGAQLLYLQYCFRMVFVTSISWSGGGGEELPKETVKFRFGAMGIQYIRQKATGEADTKNKQIAMWSTTNNKPTLACADLADNANPWVDVTQSV